MEISTTLVPGRGLYEIATTANQLSRFDRGLHLRLNQLNFEAVLKGDQVHYQKKGERSLFQRGLNFLEKYFLRKIPLTESRDGDRLVALTLRDNQANIPVDINPQGVDYRLTDLVVDMMEYHNLIAQGDADKIRPNQRDVTYNFRTVEA